MNQELVHFKTKHFQEKTAIEDFRSDSCWIAFYLEKIQTGVNFDGIPIPSGILPVKKS